MSRDRTAIIKECLELNNITYRDVIKITGKTENTVFKWLNKTLIPDDGSIMKIRAAIFSAKMKMPRELSREVNSILTPAHSWAKKNKTDRKSVEYVGETLREPSGSVMYKYHGESMNRGEIVRKSGLSYHRLYGITRQLKPGDDVTELVDKKVRRKEA